MAREQISFMQRIADCRFFTQVSSTTSFERSRDRACQFMREYAGAVTYGFNYITNEEFCQAADDDTCTNIIDAVFAIAGKLAS